MSGRTTAGAHVGIYATRSNPDNPAVITFEITHNFPERVGFNAFDAEATVLYAAASLLARDGHHLAALAVKAIADGAVQHSRELDQLITMGGEA